MVVLNNYTIVMISLSISAVLIVAPKLPVPVYILFTFFPTYLHTKYVLIQDSLDSSKTVAVTLLITLFSSLIIATALDRQWPNKFNDIIHTARKIDINRDDIRNQNQATALVPNQYEDHLKHIIAKPRLTFHYFYRDVWKQAKASGDKRSVTLIAVEASRKWSRMTRLDRSKYKAHLEKRLQWQGIKYNKNRLSMTQLINSQ